MMSLFSSFDYFWLIFPKFFGFLILLSILTGNFFYNSVFKSLLAIFNYILKFLDSLSPAGFKKSVNHIILSLMFFLILLNFSAVFPFVFAHSAQVNLILCVGLSIWLALMSFYNFWNFKSFSSHCIPEGSPMVLVPVLFAIEIVSNIIRPVTLTVRLVANILAGHLLLILISKIVYAFPLTMPLYFGLNLVEFFVALIQAYIFVTMITLYYCDLA